MKTKLLKRIRATADDLFRVTSIIIKNSCVTSVSVSCHHQLIGYADEITTKISHDATSFDSAVEIAQRAAWHIYWEKVGREHWTKKIRK